MQYLQRVTRVRSIAREYWYELLIVLLTVAAMLQLIVNRDSPGAPTVSLWLSVPAMAVLVLPLLARRRFPFGAPAAYWLLAVGITLFDGTLIPFVDSLSVVGLAAAFLLGNLRDGKQAWLGLAIVIGSMLIVVDYIPGPQPWSWYVFITLRYVASWIAGYALRERSEQAEAAEVRAAQAEREREAAARVAVAEERARIARELHDVVAHAVSVMVLQVGAVRHGLPAALAEDRDALRRVERAGRTALVEMRRLLAAMRRDGEEAEFSPQPGLDGLDSLLEEVGRAGLPVALHLEGEPVPAPARNRPLRLSDRSGGPDERAQARTCQRRRCHRPLSTGRAGDRGARQRRRHCVERRARTRAGRDPRAGQDLRWRDERTGGTRGWVRPQYAPPGRRGGSMTTRVLVVDDQSMVRAGFRMLLAGEEDIEVVAEASNGLEAVEKAARYQPGVVLMDIRMPELDGIQATRRILAADRDARILILTTFDLDEYVYEALRAGASGFVLKDDSPEQLIAAIRTVAAGDALLSPTITRRVIQKFARMPRPAPPKELEELSEREREVFRLMARGLSNAEIGEDLFISETTVKTHVTHILAKLNLRDRVQAVVLAYQTGLFEQDALRSSGRDEGMTG